MKVLMIIALIAPVAAKPTWSTSSPELNRRLEIAVGASHNDTDDAGCIVGGFDTENPSHVFVGGPCSALEFKNGQPSPTANFRYVSMATVDVDILGTDGGEVGLKPIAGQELVHSQEHESHFEVGVASPFVLEDNPTAPHAALFASTTSYLSKASFGYKRNTFMLGRDKDSGDFEAIDVCVTPCKDANGAFSECADNKCPADELQVTPGQYKYSILAAAYDNADTGYIAGADGNGWLRLVKEHGGADQKLKGWLRVFQVIDFTELKADKLEVTDAAGTGKVMFADMKECDVATDNVTDCYARVPDAAKPLAVGGVTVTSDTWAGSYSFPQYYNRGQWESKAKAAGATRRLAEPKVNIIATTTPLDSKVVKIHMVKFAPKTLVALELAKDEAEAKLKKMALLVYHFDISGIDGEKEKGKFMVYDPTISTVKSSATTKPATTAKTKVQGSVTLAITLPKGQTAAQWAADADVKKGIVDALEEQYGYPAGSLKDVVLTEDFKVAYTVEVPAADVKKTEDNMKKALTDADKTAFATKLKTKLEKATGKKYTVEVKKAAYEGTVAPATSTSFARSSAEPAFLFAMVTAIAYAGL